MEWLACYPLILKFRHFLLYYPELLRSALSEHILNQEKVSLTIAIMHFAVKDFYFLNVLLSSSSSIQNIFANEGQYYLQMFRFSTVSTFLS